MAHPASYLSHLECSKKCDESTIHLNPDVLHNLCPKCAAPLLVRYNLEDAKQAWSKESLVTREKTLWRYHEVLPVRDLRHKVSLGEGLTPLWKAQELGAALKLDELWFKDEGVIPTGTFKARGAAVGISRAKELGVKTIAMPTNGNAGAAWAAYGARAGIQLVVAMPVDAPPLAVEEIIAYGARAYMVNGQITDAGKMIATALKTKKDDGWFDASTLKEPYRIEGKKTMGYEIAEQFNWQLPDVIIYPTGGGVGLIGIYKAFEELQSLGWVAPGPLPKMVAVQAAGCAPIVKVKPLNRLGYSNCQGMG
jgi:threonine synthase